MKLFQTFLCFFVFSVLTQAQPVIAGLKIGAPLTSDFQNQPPLIGPTKFGSGSYTLGPFVEVRLPLHFSIEGDALYHGVQVYPFVAYGSPTSTTVSQWDFPIVAKYKFLKGPVKPYVAGGLDFSHLSDARNLFVANHTSNFGVVLGAGLEVHALVLRISPEVRYTGYALQDFNYISNRNQVAFLVGIGF